MKKYVIIPAFIFLLIPDLYCNGNEKDKKSCSASQINIPGITLECDRNGKALHCQDESADEKQFFAYWMPEDFTCNGFDSAPGKYFAAGKGPVSCDSEKCSGKADTWVDEEGSPAEKMNAGLIKACVYIDTNGDGEQSLQEPVSHFTFTLDNCDDPAEKTLSVFFDAN